MSFLSFLRSHRPAPAGRSDLLIDAGAYPSVDPGIEARSVDEMLSAHDDLISRIKLCYGCDRAAFTADLLVPIRNYAGFVNLLPATADNFFCEIGGLFGLGLEVAFFALQGTDGHIVSGRSTISTRRLLEPRWRHATFLAGLCSEVHRTLSQVIVTDDRGEEWPPYLGPLTQWLHHRRSKRFFVRWLANAQESRAVGLFALPHLVPAQMMQHLAMGNSIAVPQMLACLSGLPLYREQNLLVDLVKRAAALVIDRNLIASANRYGKPILGAHLERYLIDAMRRLIVSNAAWAPNQERSRVWYGKDGLFIVWPHAFNEIRRLLEGDELPGIPKSPETILEILLGAGVLEARSAERTLWNICPPPGQNVIEAVKLSSPDILLSAHADVHAPLPQALASRPDPAAASSSPSRPTAATGHRSSPDQPPPPSGGPATAGARAQLSLVTDDASSDAPAAPHADATPPPVEAPPLHAVEPVADVQPALFFRLNSPARLNPQVRDALSLAIDSLNGDPRKAVAITVPTGVFVALDHFKRSRLDIPVVLRALSDAGMSVRPRDGSRVATVEHELRGQAEVGVVLKPAFVQGLNLADFTPAA